MMRTVIKTMKNLMHTVIKTSKNSTHQNLVFIKMISGFQ